MPDPVSTLSLLVPGIYTYNAQRAAASDDLTVIANFLYRTTYFHDSTLQLEQRLRKRAQYIGPVIGYRYGMLKMS